MKRNHHILLVTLLGMVWLAAGCSRDPEPALRQRVQAFTQLLLDDQFEPAVDYFDPAIVNRKGRNAIADSFKLIITVSKKAATTAGREPAGFAVRQINFFADKTEATVHLAFASTDSQGRDRREMPSEQKWVLKNKVWYATQ